MKEVAAGMAAGIAFLMLFAILPIATYPGYRASWAPVDSEDYPYLQLHIIGLKEAYATGERIDFHVMQKAGGCAYPDYIAVKNLKSGSIIFEFNGTEANSLLFCPALILPTDTKMRWNSDDWTERLIAISEPGSYAVVVEHLYMTVVQNFKVVGGVDYVSVVTMPGGFNDYNSVSFKPRDPTVVIGTNNTVRWINNDYYANRLGAAGDESWLFGTDVQSRLLNPADSFEHTFDQPGRYSYQGNDSQLGTITALPELQ